MNKYNQYLWYFAVFFFMAGDVVSTIVGIQFHLITEATPLYSVILDKYGLIAMSGTLILLKFMAILVSWYVWVYLEHYFRYVFPGLLLGTGLIATVWNSYLIYGALV